MCIFYSLVDLCAGLDCVVGTSRQLSEGPRDLTDQYPTQLSHHDNHDGAEGPKDVRHEVAEPQLEAGTWKGVG